jgi:hypothetical protein
MSAKGKESLLRELFFLTVVSFESLMKMNPLYQHFSRVGKEENYKMERYSCNYCGKRMARKLDYFKLHCEEYVPGVPASSVANVHEPGTSSATPSSSQSSCVSSRHPASSSGSSIPEWATAMKRSGGVDDMSSLQVSKKSRQPTLSFFHRLSPVDQKEAAQTFARMFYVCNYSFRSCNNPLWTEFLSKLNISFRKPGRKSLANALLSLRERCGREE